MINTYFFSRFDNKKYLKIKKTLVDTSTLTFNEQNNSNIV